MTADQKIVIKHCLEAIEPALTPGSTAHANYLVLRGLLEESHTAQSHAPKRRGRRPKLPIDPETGLPA